MVRFWSPWLKTHASFSLHGHETSVIGVNYMPDGVRLATLDVSRVVRIWDSKGQCGVSVITEGFHGITTDAYATPHPPPLTQSVLAHLRTLTGCADPPSTTSVFSESVASCLCHFVLTFAHSDGSS